MKKWKLLKFLIEKKTRGLLESLLIIINYNDYWKAFYLNGIQEFYE